MHCEHFSVKWLVELERLEQAVLDHNLLCGFLHLLDRLLLLVLVGHGALVEVPLPALAGVLLRALALAHLRAELAVDAFAVVAAGGKKLSDRH